METVENALYIVPTPIGNMLDISYRAVNILRGVDCIACEDTRHSGILLKNLKIVPKKLLSYHEHNEDFKSGEIVELIKSGKSIALISDAGTPLVSDPGYRLVNKAIQEEIKIISLPGATAFVPALSLSGFPTDKFCFLGFPPQKKGRKTFLENLISYSPMTIILYESPHRIVKLLTELNNLYHDTLNISISREISKLHEEVVRGMVAEVLSDFEARQSIKGEFVVVLNFIKE